jgi:hypothetical protein
VILLAGALRGVERVEALDGRELAEAPVAAARRVGLRRS